jgi:predicted secreted protein
MLETISLSILTFMIVFWTMIFAVLPLRYSFKLSFLITFMVSAIITFFLLSFVPQALEELSNICWEF